MRFLITNKNLIVKKQAHLKTFIKVHIFVFIANYLFAFYNTGNVEFMVMLPFLVVLYVTIKYDVNYKLLQKIVALLFVWNFSYGIFPNFKYNYYNDIKLVDYMIENKEKIFIVKNHTAVSQYFYKTGIDNPKNIIRLDKVNKEKLCKMIVSNEIYTDAIDKPKVFNKEQIILKDSDMMFKNLKRDKVFCYEGFYGKTTVYKVFDDSKLNIN